MSPFAKRFRSASLYPGTKRLPLSTRIPARTTWLDGTRATDATAIVVLVGFLAVFIRGGFAVISDTPDLAPFALGALVLVTTGLFLIARRQYGLRLADVGLSLDTLAGGLLRTCVLCGATLLVLGIVDGGINLRDVRWLPIVAGQVFANAPAEEVIWRGFLLVQIYLVLARRGTTGALAIAIVSSQLLFGASHVFVRIHDGWSVDGDLVLDLFGCTRGDRARRHLPALAQPVSRDGKPRRLQPGADADRVVPERRGRAARARPRARVCVADRGYGNVSVT